MSILKAAIADAILTFLWVFTLPFLGTFTATIVTFLGLQSLKIMGIFISTIITTIMVLIFSFTSDILGGASFNPSTTVTLYVAGIKPADSLFSMAIRFPAQAIGGVGGAKAIMKLMPTTSLKGPYLKVDLHTGAVVEGLLTFVLCFSLLAILFKGPKNMLVKLWFLALTTVGLVSVGFKYTGPSMNPANAFGWAYVNNWHNSWDLFYVYWICPFIGATLAARVFQFLFPPPTNKEKKT